MAAITSINGWLRYVPRSIKATVVCCLFNLAFVCLCTASEPLFTNSVASNDIDFIVSSDSTVQSQVEYHGAQRREMPDKRRNELMDDDVYTFTLSFEDSTVVDVWAHSDFDTVQDAGILVDMIAKPLGKLPYQMRARLARVILHKGNETAFAEHLGHFFVLYSENIINRVENNDLEETIFHESVHATLDFKHRETTEWIEAQEKDNNFVTSYAAQNPGEDLAETALFSYTLYKHPGRLPIEIETWLETNIPHRHAYLSEVFSSIDTKPPHKFSAGILDKIRSMFKK